MLHVENACLTSRILVSNHGNSPGHFTASKMVLGNKWRRPLRPMRIREDMSEPLGKRVPYEIRRKSNANASFQTFFGIAFSKGDGASGAVSVTERIPAIALGKLVRDAYRRWQLAPQMMPNENFPEPSALADALEPAYGHVDLLSIAISGEESARG